MSPRVLRGLLITLLAIVVGAFIVGALALLVVTPG
jgi:hypothetical protein